MFAPAPGRPQAYQKDTIRSSLSVKTKKKEEQLSYSIKRRGSVHVRIHCNFAQVWVPSIQV